MTTTFPFGYHDAVALSELHESSWNPRRTYDPAKLDELAVSLKEKGCLTPLIGRPRKGGGIEIGAGHRRRRAADLAKLPALPVVVRNLNDVEFLELLVIENDQREDVHELEQADGYKRLMLQDGYTAQRIADRIGRSEKFVYDRVKLLQLIPLGQQLFLAGKMTAGHAILLARLNAKDQERAIDPIDGGAFTGEGGLLMDDEPPGKKGSIEYEYHGYKPKSVRELDAWINDHVRLDPKKADPFLFPDVIEAQSEAPKPLVSITYDHFLRPEARDSTVRTYGPASWKRADGTADGGKKHHSCQYAVPAVIVAGEGRGDTFSVCLSSNRDKCAMHWSKEKKDAEARRKQNEKGTSTRRVDNTFEKQQERRKAEEARRETVQARYKTAAPAIVTAIAAAIDKAPLARIGNEVLAYVAPDRYSRPVVKLEDFHQAGKTAESILRHAALSATLNDLAIYRIDEELTRAGKTWGVDVKAILDKAAPAPKAEKPAESTPKKKAAKR